MGFAEILSAGDLALRNNAGENVVYTSGLGASVTVRGLFDAAYVRVDAGTAGIASVGPAVTVWTDDLPSDPVTDTDATVTFGGKTYKAREAHPDGRGAVVLLLHEV